MKENTTEIHQSMYCYSTLLLL